MGCFGNSLKSKGILALEPYKYTYKDISIFIADSCSCIPETTRTLQNTYPPMKKLKVEFSGCFVMRQHIPKRKVALLNFFCWNYTQHLSLKPS